MKSIGKVFYDFGNGNAFTVLDVCTLSSVDD